MHVLEKKEIRLLRCPGRVLLAYVEGKGVVVVAKRDIRRGEKVLPLRGTVVRSPSKWGVQIGRDAHVDSDEFRPEDFISHSCSANMRLDVDQMWWVATRRIPAHHEVTYNYLTTEYSMRSRSWFKCRCGSKNCYGSIRGFKHLTSAQKLSLKPLLTPFLREFLRKEIEQKELYKKSARRVGFAIRSKPTRGRDHR